MRAVCSVRRAPSTTGTGQLVDVRDALRKYVRAVNVLALCGLEGGVENWVAVPRRVPRGGELSDARPSPLRAGTGEMPVLDLMGDQWVSADFQRYPEHVGVPATAQLVMSSFRSRRFGRHATPSVGCRFKQPQSRWHDGCVGVAASGVPECGMVVRMDGKADQRYVTLGPRQARLLGLKTREDAERGPGLAGGASGGAVLVLPDGDTFTSLESTALRRQSDDKCWQIDALDTCCYPPAAR